MSDSICDNCEGSGTIDGLPCRYCVLYRCDLTLLPCPHCGEPGMVIEITPPSARYSFSTKAKCSNCHHSTCGESLEACAALSAKSWNKRATASPLSIMDYEMAVRRTMQREKDELASTLSRVQAENAGLIKIANAAQAVVDDQREGLTSSGRIVDTRKLAELSELLFYRTRDLDIARAALDRAKGVHSPSCRMSVPGDQNGCTCGLTSALTIAKENTP